jgi:hypothetical protein
MVLSKEVIQKEHMLLVYEADGNNKRVCACMKQSE